MLRAMRPGSVLVDIAIDQGGCAETSRPTTHHDPVFVEEGVTHYCVANMPGAYARTATQALTNVTYRYIEILADHGIPGAFAKDPNLLAGLNVANGQLTFRIVADARGCPFCRARGRGVGRVREYCRRSAGVEAARFRVSRGTCRLPRGPQSRRQAARPATRRGTEPPLHHGYDPIQTALGLGKWPSHREEP